MEKMVVVEMERIKWIMNEVKENWNVFGWELEGWSVVEIIRKWDKIENYMRKEYGWYGGNKEEDKWEDAFDADYWYDLV